MKKFSLIVLVMLIPFVALAASYGDNQYQKLAEAYTVRAQDAFDSGEYDLAVEYTIKAEENAELSRQYVEMMLLRSEADTQIRVARNRLVWARSIKADENFPEMYNESMSLVEQAQVAFSGEKYEEAKKLALQSMDALAGLQEMDDERKRLEEEALAKAKKGVYPEYYIIHDWNKTKDCFWNIAAKPFVYNDPYKWEVLYEANRGVLDNASNPDIIQPEIKIRIPSLAGEVREGTYDPEQEYNVFEEK
ncbi:MAG: hypothetical protein J6K76_03165 [Spirochaetaceae bacterium]|nr:hypothetical protein [Spirochaetaceae bacterium]